MLSFSGALKLASLDAMALLPVLAGPSGTVAGSGLWPEGPIDIGSGPRSSVGRIDVEVVDVSAGGRPLLKDAKFGLDWDAQSISLRDLTGIAEDGTLTLDVTVCCSNPALPAKQISGRLALNDVPLDLVVPGGLAEGLDGKLDGLGGVRWDRRDDGRCGAAMTGTGSYTISDFTVGQFRSAEPSTASVH